MQDAEYLYLCDRRHCVTAFIVTLGVSVEKELLDKRRKEWTYGRMGGEATGSRGGAKVTVYVINDLVN